MDRISRCGPGQWGNYDPAVYRVVFCSSAPIGVPFLEELMRDDRYDVVGILTMPDMPSGRGLQMQENIIKTESWKFRTEEVAFDIKTPQSLRLDSKKYAQEAQDTFHWLQSLEIDYLIVIAYGHIIPQHILDIPRIAPINVHGSLLPLYRGASPIQASLLHGQEETGITIMRMVAELDAGDMIRFYRFPLPLARTARDIIEKMKSVWPTFLTETLDGLSHGEYIYTPQDPEKATFCGKIEKEDGEVSLINNKFLHIYNKYRAYYLWPKIYFWMKYPETKDPKRVIIEDIQIDEWLFILHNHKPFCDKNRMLNCAIVSCSVKVEGKKTMTRAEWAQTYRDYIF